jgi:putative addiction module CopG family antidote
MTLTLSPETEMLIQRQIDSGRYRDADEVIRHAILELEESEGDLDDLRAEIVKGLDQLQRGEGERWTPALMDRLKFNARENARLGRPIKDAVKP